MQQTWELTVFQQICPLYKRHHRPIPSRTENAVAQKVVKQETSARVTFKKNDKVVEPNRKRETSSIQRYRRAAQKVRTRRYQVRSAGPKTNQRTRRKNKQNESKNERTHGNFHHRQENERRNERTHTQKQQERQKKEKTQKKDNKTSAKGR